MNQVTDLVQRGVAALNQNNPIEARLAFEQAAAHDKDCLDAYWGLALLRFPGESYYGLLARLHHALRPRSYVEIGVESGTSMALALPQTACVGIDPAPAISVSFVTPPKIFTMTSGDFFARHDLSAELGNKPVDLAFIDGLHVFENVLEDFINIERFAAPGATVLIHDCLPIDERTAARERDTLFWTGDVWRILPTLAHFRPDLKLHVVECAPSGMALIRGLNPRSQVLYERRAEAVA